MKPTTSFKKLLLPTLLGVALCAPAYGVSYQFRLSSVGLVSPLAAPTIAPWALSAVNVGDAPFTLTPPSSNSAGTFTFSSSDPLIASVSGNIVTILAAGTTTITANQSATASYLAGTTSASLLVNPPACSAPNSVYSNAATVNVTVPAGCTMATIKAWGAGGGGGYTAYSWQQNTGGAGGAGGFAKGTVSVTPGSTLAVVVGGSGGGSAGASPGTAIGGTPGNGGYGANNNGSSTHLGGAGGGGYSGVYRGTVAQANALVVAGAGGGAGSEEHGSSLYAGGAGGGLTGVVSGTSASGGTQTGGGPARGSGLATAGSALQGGGASQNNGGGGGGGGYFGGGGGGLYNCNSYGGCGYGGGGGSSFIISSATGASTIAGGISTTTSRAAAPNTGDVDYATSVGYGGAPGAPGQNGGRGKVVIIWSAQ